MIVSWPWLFVDVVVHVDDWLHDDECPCCWSLNPKFFLKKPENSNAIGCGCLSYCFIKGEPISLFRLAVWNDAVSISGTLIYWIATALTISWPMPCYVVSCFINYSSNFTNPFLFQFLSKNHEVFSTMFMNVSSFWLWFLIIFPLAGF